MRVLFVEDQARQRSPPGAGLRETGCAVDFVSEADRAIALATGHRYDVVILDLVPPREKGLRVLHEIRENNREIGILILTGRDQIHDRVTALIQGADDFLQKPCSAGELQERIGRLLRTENEPASTGDAGRFAIDHAARKSRLIADLLDRCRCDRGPIEPLISEVKPGALLNRVRADLDGLLRQKAARLELPGGKPPTLLCDAGLMHHLLVKLMSYATRLCPAGAKIDVGVVPSDGYCTISIEGPLVGSPPRPERLDLIRNKSSPLSVPATDRRPADLSLARNYAESLNLELHISRVSGTRFRMTLSRIKLV